MEIVQGFTKSIGVKYTLVYSDFYNIIRDLLGKDVVRKESEVSLTGNYAIKGDMIATGFTILPWRKSVLLFSKPTFPSQVLLVARADSRFVPIKGSSDLLQDIRETKSMIGKNSLLVMERTCLDPANYGLKGIGIDLRSYTKSTNLNEIVPALLNGEDRARAGSAPVLRRHWQLGPPTARPVERMSSIWSRSRRAGSLSRTSISNSAR